MSHNLQNFFVSRGILHQKSCPYTPEQNGVAERKHGHIVEMALSMMSKTSVPLRFSYFAFATITFLINRLPSPSLDNKSSFEILYSSKSDYSFL